MKTKNKILWIRFHVVDKINHIIGLILFKIGIKPNCSSDMMGNITYGYGKLDWYGYWQFPIYKYK